METVEYSNEFIDRYEAIGEARGKAAGQALGEALGDGKALLRILRARAIALTDDQHEQVTTATDLGTIEKWIDRALTATSADDVFKV